MGLTIVEVDKLIGLDPDFMSVYNNHINKSNLPLMSCTCDNDLYTLQFDANGLARWRLKLK